MKVDYETREVSHSRYTINIVISDISTEEGKDNKTLSREGPLLQPS
ncbi:hypothetical protein [Brassicibacter mesophilus]